jgi:predicted transcriptional regulator
MRFAMAAQLLEDFWRKVKRVMTERVLPLIHRTMKWTKRVVADPSAASGTPSRWFGSDAARTLETTSTPEATVKLLSEENIALLHLIVTRRPATMRELARFARRAESNLSRTLKKLHALGIVDFEKGPRRTLVPRVTARRVTLELDLVGGDSFASVERHPARGSEPRSITAPSNPHRPRSRRPS